MKIVLSQQILGLSHFLGYQPTKIWISPIKMGIFSGTNITNAMGLPVLNSILFIPFLGPRDNPRP
jgi:hypothetical protein